MENLGVHDIEQYLEEIPDDTDIVSDFGEDIEDETFEFDHHEAGENYVEAIKANFEFDIENMG